MRKLFVFTLLLLVLVVGASATGASEAAASAAPRVKMTAFWSDGLAPPKGRMLEYINNKFNADWDIQVIPISDYSNRLSMAMASGEMADLIQVRSPTGDGARLNREMIDAGVVMPLDPYLDKYPVLKAYLNHPEAKRFSQWDGKYYVVPKKYFYHNQLTYYRKDLFDKYGLKLPTTTDEFYTSMKIISDKEGIPACTAQGPVSGSTRILLGAYNGLGGGVLPRWKWKNGSYVDVTVEPETREGLRYLNKLYANGLLDKEYVIINDTTKMIEKFMTGKVVSMFINIEATWWDQLIPVTEKNVPGAKVQAMITPIGPNGNKESSVVSAYGTVDMLVGKNSKNPEKVLELWNFLFSPEGELFNKYGIEGVHWSKDAKGNVSINQTEVDKDITGPADAISKWRWLSDILPTYLRPGSIDVEARQELLRQGQARGTTPWVVGFTSKTLQKVLPTLVKYEAEYFNNFITGQLSLDKDWDAFVKTYTDAGLSDLTKEVNAYAQTPTGKAKCIQEQTWPKQ